MREQNLLRSCPVCRVAMVHSESGWHCPQCGSSIVHKLPEREKPADKRPPTAAVKA